MLSLKQRIVEVFSLETATVGHLKKKNIIIWIFIISERLAVPLNPYKWSSTVFLQVCD